MIMSSRESTCAKPYVLVWNSDCTDDTLTVIGPFSCHEAAACWATNPDHNATDDPCWQTLDLRDPTKVRVLPPGSEAVAAVRAIWPAEMPPLNIKFATEPYTLATVVKEQTAALMNLVGIDMPDAERADVIACALRDFAHLVLNLPEDSRGFGV
jgi:hypothetical protein